MSDASVMSYNAALAAIVRLYKSGVDAVLLLGPPGTGKTAMRHEIAQRTGLAHQFMIKLAHHEVPDVAGVPVARDDTKRTHFYPSADMLPPEGLTGGLLFTSDETGDCNVSQQNLLCQMVFEKRVHTYEFPPNTKFFMTSNRVADRSGANRIATKLGNRAATITLRPTPDELFMYGAKAGWNAHVLAFVKMKGSERINPSDNRADAPTYFNSFDPSDPAQMVVPQFASSRSYEFASNYLHYIDRHEPGLDAGTVVSELAAIIGTPVASALGAFRKIASQMPDPYAILAGKTVAYPTKQEVLWSLTLTLASKAEKANVKHLHAWLDRGPEEYLALAARVLFDTRASDLAGPEFNKMIMSPKLKAMFSGV